MWLRCLASLHRLPVSASGARTASSEPARVWPLPSPGQLVHGRHPLTPPSYAPPPPPPPRDTSEKGFFPVVGAGRGGEGGTGRGRRVWNGGEMDFWPEFMATTWGREFVAGGIGGMAGVIAGYPLDTLRVRLQQPPATAAAGLARRPPSAVGLLRSILASEGPAALYRGMGAPLASVAFQNAMVFQVYAVSCRALSSNGTDEPPSFQTVALSGVGIGALQSLILSPVELVKIKLQLQMVSNSGRRIGPTEMVREIIRKEGITGLYRGLLITVLRDAPAHGVYFWTYEYAREKLHPGCRRTSQESFGTMLFAGGLAGVASWILCYPQDVVKSRLQAQSKPRAHQPPPKYLGIVDCFRKSVQEEGVSVLFRGLGTAVTRAFVVNGAIFGAYELALRLW